MPDLQRLLAPYQRQFRVSALSAAVAVGSASGALLAVLVAIGQASTLTVRSTALASAMIVGATAASIWWRHWTLSRVARAIEARRPGLDNLVITAQELAGSRGKPLHPIIEAELLAQAAARLRQTSPSDVRPIAASLGVAVVSIVGFAITLITVPSRVGEAPSVPAEARGAESPLMPGDLRLVVTSPAYAQRPLVDVVNPTSVTVLEGSTVRMETSADVNNVRLIDTELKTAAFTRHGSRFVHEFIASGSRALIVQYDDRRDVDRLVQLRVDADLRPVVGIRAPAKDLLFPAPSGQVPLEIEASDDVGLKSLVLRYTRVAGSGESFTFEEGELPLQIARDTTGAWRARGVLALDTLKLEDGDTVVYRAVATDFKPGADPSSSDTFLIEIGRLAGVASTGFALPDDRDRQAISQQMLIIKTERLHSARGTMPSDAFAEQSRMLAIEQRMVKAEFVFMTGGEVADEIQEAEHAHELAEGRLENAGQVELLTAIREMSRAEARLNDADTARGLEFERAALKALQRAFDRRRYLLRTLPERSRVDTTRRLTGELATARSSTQEASPAPQDSSVARARVALRALAGLAHGAGEPASIVASRIMAVDPASEPLQTLAFQLTTARDQRGRQTAAEAAQAALIDLMKSRLARGASDRLSSDPAIGRVADELTRPGVRR